jgi:succinyl-diaminopimelate desuccinylase
MNDPVGIAQSLIRCRSITPAEGGALRFLERLFKDAGFDAHRVTFDAPGTPSVENLFAKIGSGAPHLAFAGHTDVVPPGDEARWKHGAFAGEVKDGVLYGRGAVDMKGGIAAFAAAALDYAKANKGKLKGTISFLITGDEEGPGVNGTVKLLAWAKERGEVFDHCIVGEPTSVSTLGDTIKIGRRGSLSGAIVVSGTQGHVAYPERANNPMPVLARVVTALDTEIDAGTDHFPASNLEVTSIDVGNAVSNVIPAAGTIRFNIRYNDLWTPQTLADWVRRRIATVDAQGAVVSFTVAGTPSRSFLSPLSDDVETLSAAIGDVTGRKPAFSTGGGTSDARFIAQYGPVVECGLVGPSMHKADEHILLSDLTGLTALYREFMTRFFGAGA